MVKHGTRGTSSNFAFTHKAASRVNLSGLRNSHGKTRYIVRVGRPKLDDEATKHTYRKRSGKKAREEHTMILELCPNMAPKTDPKSTPKRSKIDIKIKINIDFRSKTKCAQLEMVLVVWAGTPPAEAP